MQNAAGAARAILQQSKTSATHPRSNQRDTDTDEQRWIESPSDKESGLPKIGHNKILPDEGHRLLFPNLFP
jgi:hypothetical protein